VPINDMLAQNRAASGIDPDVYREVLEQFHLAMKLDAGKIRPSDKLEDIFALDSWELSHGQEQFEAWLIKRSGKQAGFENAVTIADVVRVIQDAGNGPLPTSHLQN
jgi:hypothetical protein